MGNVKRNLANCYCQRNTSFLQEIILWYNRHDQKAREIEACCSWTSSTSLLNRNVHLYAVKERTKVWHNYKWDVGFEEEPGHISTVDVFVCVILMGRWPKIRKPANVATINSDNGVRKARHIGGTYTTVLRAEILSSLCLSTILYLDEGENSMSSDGFRKNHLLLE